MMNGKMTRAALGQVAALGDLYDARTDNFCGISIFKRQIPALALNLTDNHYTDIQIIHSDTFTEKFSKLDVQAELQVSVLAGLFSLQGSGRCLNDQKNSARTVKSSLLYSIKSKEETVNVYHEDLKGAFALEAIESGIATHVVAGITWGANSVLSCEFQNTDNKDEKEIEGSLKAELKKMSLSISGEAGVIFREGDNNKNVNFDIRIFGDILPQNQELPTTVEGALNLMKQMPNIVATSNGGRGKPLTYHLIPLSLLKGYLNFTMKVDSTVKLLEEKSLLTVVQLFDRITQSQQELYDFYQDTINYKFCVSPEDVRSIQVLKREYALVETKLRSELAVILSNVRSGKADISELEGLIQEYLSGDLSPDKLANQFTTWGYITEKTAFAKSLIANGATYIGFGSSLDDQIVKNLDTKTFVLYFKEEAKTNDIDLWKKNWQLFLQELMKATTSKYFAVDCDIHPTLWPAIGVSIEVVQNGKVFTDNLLLEHEQTNNVPIAHCIMDMERVINKPNNRTNLYIACTGRNCKPQVEYEWMCGKCKENIEYGFDSFFYCMCGRGPAELFEFKCPDPGHGVAFEKHDHKYMEGLLSRLRPFKEMNILILGETGVGKSTWINGFVNYLTNESLPEAETSELITLIPSKFTVCDEDYEEITVCTGTDKNEVLVTGQSATQECKVYPFVLGDRRIRLIDTPGIGDTRGVTQDKVNFQNILSTISYLEELHGICIFLKPNNARLGVMFKFCIKELLTYLHRDASHNIVFCFTNTHGTFHRPGDTMPNLKVLLKDNIEVQIPISKHTIYCYDSESYRFLAAVKNKLCPVKFAEEERKSYVESWERSFEETKRMLRHISDLTPHRIKSTLNLNHARDIIIKLTKPLAEISKKIQETKAVIEDEKRDIERTKEDFKELEKKKNITRPDLRIIELEYPRTVCTDQKCKRFYNSGGETKIKYVSLCHDPCSLKGITSDTIGHEGWCTKCSLHYKVHQHIYFDTEDIIIEVEDEGIKELVRQNISASELKQRMIKAKNVEVDEHNKELKEIEIASVKFAHFLKANAITPYNDAMIDYMNHLISEEEGKVGAGGSDKTLRSLKENKASYEIQIKILANEIAKSSDGGKSAVLKPEDVNTLVNRLEMLKHSGRKIKEALSAVDHTHQHKAVYNECVSPLLMNEKQKKASQKKWYQFWKKS